MFLLLAWAAAVAMTAATCPGRTYLALNVTDRGQISSGEPQYPAASTCEWLLDAPAGYAVQLEFSMSITECNFDYIYVYDGLVPSAPLLAVHSGSTLLDTLLARSGKMLVYLYSDQNYVLAGLRASYAVIPLPPVPAADDITPSTGHLGREDHWLPLIRRGSWAARAELTAVADDGIAWLFGGFDYNQLYADVVRVDLSTGQSTAITPTGSAQPAARRAHSAVLFRGRMLILGGTTASARSSPEQTYDPNFLSDELWEFDLQNKAWTLHPVAPGVVPPLAGHSATLVNSVMVVLGGRSVIPPYMIDVLEYDLTLGTWTRHTPAGALPHLAAHTAVYHAASNLIYLFGGFQAQWAGYSARVNRLYTYHVPSRRFALVEPTGVVPSAVAMHQAVLWSPDTMLVFGGNQHQHYGSEICYSPYLYAYNIVTNRWRTFDTTTQADAAVLLNFRFSFAMCLSDYCHISGLSVIAEPFWWSHLLLFVSFFSLSFCSLLLYAP